MKFALALITSIALAAVVAAADLYRHVPSGLDCLPEIAGFTLQTVYEDEKAYPGHGVTCAYVAPQYGAHIQIFNEKLPSVPADINHPAFVQLHDRTLRDIERTAQSHNETARLMDHAVLNVDTARGPIPVYYDAYVVESPKLGTRTEWAWLWTSRNHFVKIRMTRVGTGSLSPRRAREFFDAVVRLAAE